MTQEEFEKGTFIANMAQLVFDNASLIVHASNYDIRSDERLLIPFMKNQKIGFINRNAEVVVEPKYDLIDGEIKPGNDFIVVGVRYSFGFANGINEPRTYIGVNWGLLDLKGQVVFEPMFNSISISDDNQLFTLCDKTKGVRVVTRDGEEIIPNGKYSYIDGFTNGFARVKIGQKWGIVDRKGNLVLPVEYQNIWNFYNKPYLTSTKVIKDNVERRFYFKTGDLDEAPQHSSQCYAYERNDYGTHFGEYEGTYAQDVAGYSDDAINDAFDGEPDAYWNID